MNLISQPRKNKLNVNGFFNELGIPKEFIRARRGPVSTTQDKCGEDCYRVTVPSDVFEKYVSDDMRKEIFDPTSSIRKNYDVRYADTDFSYYSKMTSRYPTNYVFHIGIYKDEESVTESIYEQMNKIDDTESLNEKYNVKTLKDVQKLQSRSQNSLHESEDNDVRDEACDAALEYIISNNRYIDYNFESDGDQFSVTLWKEDEYGDEEEVTFTMSISKLVELVDDEDAFADYIESAKDCVNYEAQGEEFYRRAEQELEKHFDCTGAFLEPSTQSGQGATFLFADDVTFEGRFDYQTGEEYIRNNDFEGFLDLCKNSFRIANDDE